MDSSAQTQKYIFVHLLVVLLIQLDFGVSFQVWDIRHKDVCFLSRLMELDSTLLVVLKVPKSYI